MNHVSAEIVAQCISATADIQSGKRADALDKLSTALALLNAAAGLDDDIRTAVFVSIMQLKITALNMKGESDEH